MFSGESSNVSLKSCGNRDRMRLRPSSGLYLSSCTYAASNRRWGVLFTPFGNKTSAEVVASFLQVYKYRFSIEAGLVNRYKNSIHDTAWDTGKDPVASVSSVTTVKLDDNEGSGIFHSCRFDAKTCDEQGIVSCTHARCSKTPWDIEYLQKRILNLEI